MNPMSSLLIGISMLLLLFNMGLSFFLWYRYRQMTRRIDTPLLMQTEMARELKLFAQSVVAVGHHIRAVEKQVENLEKKQDTLEEKCLQQQSYSNAVKLFEMNTTPERVSAMSGLTQAELRLIQQLNRRAALQ